YNVDNDGCLFASPTTHPGKVLNGVELKGKQVPEYLLSLQRPDLQNPGNIAYWTFKFGGRLEGPDRVIMTSHGAGDDGWNVPVIAANGDSDIVYYWEPQVIAPRGKRELAYAYGQGLATSPDSEGRVNLTLGGSFEPGKQFTVTAHVDDPLPGQTVSLEL